MSLSESGYLLLTIVSVGFIIWTILTLIAALDKNPLVMSSIRKNLDFKAYRRKRKNRMKKHSFSDYPLIFSDGFVFEVLETSRKKGNVWNIRINVFNTSDETRKLQLVRTGFKWENRDELSLNSSEIYTIEPSSGLISSSHMVMWKHKKPDSINISYLSNRIPGIVSFNLHKELKAVQAMKKRTFENKISELDEKVQKLRQEVKNNNQEFESVTKIINGKTSDEEEEEKIQEIKNDISTTGENEEKTVRDNHKSGDKDL